MSRVFIECSSFFNEFRIYRSVVDYSVIFDTLSDDIKNDLEELTRYYYEYLEEELTDIGTISVPIQSVKKIDGIPVNIFMGISKDYMQYVNSTGIKSRISLSVYLSNKNYMHPEIFTLQNINLLNCNIESEDMFTNYIYNILFYAYVVIHQFKFHPMLLYLHHEEDIANLVDIRMCHVRLYGETNECCICLEKTITHTVCNHFICQRCYCKLDNKVCPLCRKVLWSDDNEDYNDIHIIIS